MVETRYAQPYWAVETGQMEPGVRGGERGRTEFGETERDAGLPDARDELAPQDDDGPAERHALPSVKTGGVPTTLSVMADMTQDWGQRRLW